MSHVPMQVQSNVTPIPERPWNPGETEVELTPPYLREVPREMMANESEYRKGGYPTRTRIVLHLLWIIFRISYHAGWFSATRAGESMPHLRLPSCSGRSR